MLAFLFHPHLLSQADLAENEALHLNNKTVKRINQNQLSSRWSDVNFNIFFLKSPDNYISK